MKIFKCNKCGNIIELLDGSNINIKCCDEELTELVANTTDAAREKHVPYTEVSEDELYVRLGETTHPMDENHYIMWIMAEYSDSIVKINLKPGEEPEAYFDYEEGMKVYTYCNLHGLWMKEL